MNTRKKRKQVDLLVYSVITRDLFSLNKTCGTEVILISTNSSRVDVRSFIIIKYLFWVYITPSCYGYCSFYAPPLCSSFLPFLSLNELVSALSVVCTLATSFLSSCLSHTSVRVLRWIEHIDWEFQENGSF
jgi:hypothetical protein